MPVIYLCLFFIFCPYNSLCLDVKEEGTKACNEMYKVDAIVNKEDEVETVYVITKDRLWEMSLKDGSMDSVELLDEVFPKVPSGIEAASYDYGENLYFFAKGDKMYLFRAHADKEANETTKEVIFSILKKEFGFSLRVDKAFTCMAIYCDRNEECGWISAIEGQTTICGFQGRPPHRKHIQCQSKAYLPMPGSSGPSQEETRKIDCQGLAIVRTKNGSSNNEQDEWTIVLADHEKVRVWQHDRLAFEKTFARLFCSSSMVAIMLIVTAILVFVLIVAVVVILVITQRRKKAQYELTVAHSTTAVKVKSKLRQDVIK